MSHTQSFGNRDRDDRRFPNEVHQFQVVGLLCLYRIQAKIGPEDITSHCPGGITVPVMIDVSDQVFVKIIGVLNCTV